MPAASAAGILVTMAPSSGAGVVELTLGLMLAVTRQILWADREMKEGKWPPILGRGLYGKTLGILGLGKVGTQVARIALGFGMKVIAWGPSLTTERAAKAHVTDLPLEEVLKTADVVSVHLKLSDLSSGLLDESHLRLMKKSAFLINTARGAIVDESALVKVLQDRAIAGAALGRLRDRAVAFGESPAATRQCRSLTPHGLADRGDLRGLRGKRRGEHPELYGRKTPPCCQSRGACGAQESDSAKPLIRGPVKHSKPRYGIGTTSPA